MEFEPNYRALLHKFDPKTTGVIAIIGIALVYRVVRRFIAFRRDASRA